MFFCTTINVGTDDVISVTTKRLRSLEGAACTTMADAKCRVLAAQFRGL